MLDEVHTGSSEMELSLARVLPKLKNVTNFKVVFLSATVNVAELMQRASEAGLPRKYIDKMDTTGRHQELVNRCLPLETPRVRDHIEMAVRAVITLHHDYAEGYPDKRTPIDGTMLVFVPDKPEILEIIELLKNAMWRGFTAGLYPYGFHSDTPAQDRGFLFKGGRDPNVSRRDELISLAIGAGYRKHVQNNSKDALKYGATAPVEPKSLPSRKVIIATNAAETAVTFEKCWLCIDTCVVNQMVYDASLRAKVQQTVPCSQASAIIPMKKLLCCSLVES